MTEEENAGRGNAAPQSRVWSAAVVGRMPPHPHQDVFRPGAREHAVLNVLIQMAHRPTLNEETPLDDQDKPRVITGSSEYGRGLTARVRGM